MLLRSPWLVLLSFLLLLGRSAFAQEGIKYFHPEKFERATKVDDKGLTQWADYKGEKCPTCSGTGKAKCTTCVRFFDDATVCIECKRNKDREVVCRACAGTGTMPDPLEKVLCAGCLGAGFLICELCAGGGRIKAGEGAKWGACPCCRGEGGYKCGVCNGTRLVETAALKPSLKDANVATLQKAIGLTDQALKELATFNPAGGDKARKEVKALAKALEVAASVHPAIKRTPKVLEDYLGKTYAGANFQGHEEKEASAMMRIKSSAEYYLKHQKRMMELAEKRAEANAKIAGEQKGK